MLSLHEIRELFVKHGHLQSYVYFQDEYEAWFSNFPVASFMLEGALTECKRVSLLTPEECAKWVTLMEEELA